VLVHHAGTVAVPFASQCLEGARAHHPTG
jgi:hypothetical protein